MCARRYSWSINWNGWLTSPLNSYDYCLGSTFSPSILKVQSFLLIKPKKGILFIMFSDCIVSENAIEACILAKPNQPMFCLRTLLIFEVTWVLTWIRWQWIINIAKQSVLLILKECQKPVNLCQVHDFCGWLDAKLSFFGRQMLNLLFFWETNAKLTFICTLLVYRHKFFYEDLIYNFALWI